MNIFAALSPVIDDRHSWVAGNVGEKSMLNPERLRWIELCVIIRIINSDKAANRIGLYFLESANDMRHQKSYESKSNMFTLWSTGMTFHFFNNLNN